MSPGKNVSVLFFILTKLLKFQWEYEAFGGVECLWLWFVEGQVFI